MQSESIEHAVHWYEGVDIHFAVEMSVQPLLSVVLHGRHSPPSQYGVDAKRVQSVLIEHAVH